MSYIHINQFLSYFTVKLFCIIQSQPFLWLRSTNHLLCSPLIIFLWKSLNYIPKGSLVHLLYRGGGSIGDFQTSRKSIRKICTHSKISNKLLDESHSKWRYWMSQTAMTSHHWKAPFPKKSIRSQRESSRRNIGWIPQYIEGSSDPPAIICMPSESTKR